MIDLSVSVVVYAVTLPGSVLMSVTPGATVTIGKGASPVAEAPLRAVMTTDCDPGTVVNIVVPC